MQLSDKFNHRLMIPIQQNQQVVGFTGRILPYLEANWKDFSPPKYLNSDESLWFQKGQIWFGLDQAIASIYRHKTILLVEGNMDVIACHRHGIEFVLASQGTSVGLSQLMQLKKYTNQLWLAFDNDNAGFVAGKKLWTLATELQFSLQVVQIPEKHKDIDEWLLAVFSDFEYSEENQKNSRENTKNAQNSTQNSNKKVPDAVQLLKNNLLEYPKYWLLKEAWPDNIALQENFCVQFLELLSHLNPFQKQEYMKYLAKEKHLSLQTLLNLDEKLEQKSKKNSQNQNILQSSKIENHPTVLHSELIENQNKINRFDKNIQNTLHNIPKRMLQLQLLSWQKLMSAYLFGEMEFVNLEKIHLTFALFFHLKIVKMAEKTESDGSNPAENEENKENENEENWETKFTIYLLENQDILEMCWQKIEKTWNFDQEMALWRSIFKFLPQHREVFNADWQMAQIFEKWQLLT